MRGHVGVQLSLRPDESSTGDHYFNSGILTCTQSVSVSLSLLKVDILEHVVCRGFTSK